MKQDNAKHESALPSARQVRRACSRELYRTAKRLKTRILPDAMARAESFYFREVALNLPFIAENRSNRKLLADWFEEKIAPEIGEMWGVETKAVADAFRDAFGG